MLRLVALLKTGAVAPSTMLNKLAAYERQNHLDLALQEIGRVERTLFMSDWLEMRSCADAVMSGLSRASNSIASGAQAAQTYRAAESGVGADFP